VFADGGMGTDRKTCTSNCVANPETQVEYVKGSPATKSLNDYFNEITKFFIEIAF
jgi:hypothetical protein